MKSKTIFILLLWMAVFYPLYPELFSTWFEDSNNSHGILVPFISLVFAWKSRQELSNIAPKINYKGALILSASLIIYLLSLSGGIAVIARSMMVFSLAGIVLFNCGNSCFRKLAFPILFLFFMIPIPVSVISMVSLPLQRIATDISAVLIRLTSIPTYQEGNMLYFAHTQLEVAEACSGIHSMMAMLMIATVIVYIKQMTNIGRVMLLILAIPIAMLANIIRVTGTGILAHFFGEVVARGFLHEFSGIVVFVLGLVLLIGIYHLIERYQTVASSRAQIDKKLADRRS